MAALVQSLPSPSSSMTMLQSRPNSSEAFQNSSPGGHNQRGSQMPMNIYNTSVGGMATGSYRGNTVSSPGTAFSFQGSSVMQGGSNPLRQHPTAAPHPRHEHRAASTPILPTMQQLGAGSSSRPRPSAASSSTPLNSTSYNPHSSNDGGSRTLATLDLNLPSTNLNTYANVAKAAPDRYKRNHRRAETAGGLINSASHPSSTTPVANMYTNPQQSSSTPALSTYSNYRGVPSQNPSSPVQNVGTHKRMTSQDDMNVRQPASGLARDRYRRRSIGGSSFDMSAAPPASTESTQAAKPKTYAAMLAAPAPAAGKENRAPTRPSFDSRRDSSESGSAASSNAKTFSLKKGSDTSLASVQQATQATKNEAKIVNVPARNSSEPNKRLANPSPLSQPISMNQNQASRPASSQASKPPAPAASPLGLIESPAAQQLAALNKKEAKKEGKSSRLRRAFSFGSAAELRKASAENSANVARDRNKLQKPQFADEDEAQQAAIVQQQEASGLGESIYSGQGHFFTGSTDNLSISSTASSASVMIRKMGKGVKKGSRSLVGLFRPKSVVGVPAADSAVPEASAAQVSMVTVEAEREKVNVNVNPHDQPGGGTGFPKLERNSMDTTGLSHESIRRISNDNAARQSIVGGERERAEVLAAVKKGILKRTDSGNISPQPRPIDAKPNFNLPQIPRVNDSPNSSAPSTPVDEHTPRGHGKTDSVHIEGEEYFLSIQNFANGSSTSMPTTPRGTTNRNISFSPRIIFHDTWPSGEYDRRGEIATCNRLTPMLAQQIKEELNSFKMEMEVHTESKVNTHFF